MNPSFSKSDKVISTRKEDLESICDHMGIQVDNPMNILTQDTAKQFLAKSTPEDLYQVSLNTLRNLGF